MEFKKCERCGCFFTSDDCVCPKCAPKDKCEISILKDYLTETSSIDSIQSICNTTGISEKNIYRYLESKDFKKLTADLNLNGNIGNISINL